MYGELTATSQFYSKNTPETTAIAANVIQVSGRISLNSSIHDFLC